MANLQDVVDALERILEAVQQGAGGEAGGVAAAASTADGQTAKEESDDAKRKKRINALREGAARAFGAAQAGADLITPGGLSATGAVGGRLVGETLRRLPGGEAVEGFLGANVAQDRAFQSLLPTVSALGAAGETPDTIPLMEAIKELTQVFQRQVDAENALRGADAEVTRDRIANIGSSDRPAVVPKSFLEFRARAGR